jgi:hypothetical protein
MSTFDPNLIQMPSKLVMAMYAILIEKSATLSSRHSRARTSHRAEASVALVSAVLGSRNRPYLEVHQVVVAIPSVGAAHINLEDAEVTVSAPSDDVVRSKKVSLSDPKSFEHQIVNTVEVVLDFQLARAKRNRA